MPDTELQKLRELAEKASLVLSILLVATCAVAQTVTTGVYVTPLMPNSGHELRSDKQTVLLAWTTTEKCYECNTRYLMNCTGPGAADCNVPPKMVVHYGWFATKAEALKTATDNQWEVSGVFDTSPLPFSRKVVQKKIPQPDLDKTTVVYEEQP